MNKLLFFIAIMSLTLAACHEANTSEQAAGSGQDASQHALSIDDGSDENEYFELLEARLDTLEAMAEEDSVCVTRWMAVSDDDGERLKQLERSLREKHGTDVPTQYRQRAQAIEARFAGVNVNLTPKIDPGC